MPSDNQTWKPTSPDPCVDAYSTFWFLVGSLYYRRAAPRCSWFKPQISWTKFVLSPLRPYTLFGETSIFLGFTMFHTSKTRWPMAGLPTCPNRAPAETCVGWLGIVCFPADVSLHEIKICRRFWTKHTNDGNALWKLFLLVCFFLDNGIFLWKLKQETLLF